MTTISVREAQASDILALESLIHNVGIFKPSEASSFAQSLYSHFQGEADGRAWFVASDGLGAAYVAPEPGMGVWNLLFLGVQPEARRSGLARALVLKIETQLRRQGARMLLIDTSTEPTVEAARHFYFALGYETASLIPDYWAPGDGKLTFCKKL